MPDPRHRLGNAGEDAVAAWLTRCEWRILARRHRSRHGGEVDLVAIDPHGILVAVEVRVRRSRRTGGPAETVNARSVIRLRRTLGEVARDHPGRMLGMRVDLVSVEPDMRAAGLWRLSRIPGIG